VRVDDALHVGTEAINQQVHADLARHSALAGEPFSFHVNNHQVGSAHPALADRGGSYQQALFVQTDGEVPVGGRNKSAFVQHAAELHNLETMLAVFGHGHGRQLKPCASCYRTSWNPYNH
jgi:hypothetical protein